MNDDERVRRRQLWRRHVVRGEDLATVVADLAAEFDIAEETLEDDLDTIDDWLPRLDVDYQIGGFSLLAELRTNRQELHQLADEARDDGDRTEERKVREEINRSLNLERRLREGDVQTRLRMGDLTVEEQIDDLL